MTAPITITATVSAWLTSTRAPAQLIDAMQRGDSEGIVDAVFFSSTDMAGAGWTKAGEADITLRVISKDECVAAAVQTLNTELERERSESRNRQQAILSRISKLQALTYEVTA